RELGARHPFRRDRPDLRSFQSRRFRGAFERPFLLEDFMHDLAGLVSEDSRRPIERLRRAQLYRYADAHGLKYPPGAPKTVLVALLEANGVDVTRPIDGISWRVVQGRDANGMPRRSEEHTSELQSRENLVC